MPLPSQHVKIEPAKVWKRWRNTAIVAAVLAFLVITLPLSLPFVMITRGRHARRVRRVARAFVCPGCGQPLGDDSPALARALWRAQLDDYARRNPGLKFNFPQPYDAACPRCRTTYAFVRQTRSFQPVPASL